VDPKDGPVGEKGGGKDGGDGTEKKTINPGCVCAAGSSSLPAASLLLAFLFLLGLGRLRRERDL